MYLEETKLGKYNIQRRPFKLLLLPCYSKVIKKKIIPVFLCVRF